MTLERGLKCLLLAVILSLIGSMWVQHIRTIPKSPLVCDPVSINRGQALVMVNCERAKYTDRINMR